MNLLGKTTGTHYEQTNKQIVAWAVVDDKNMLAIIYLSKKTAVEEWHYPKHLIKVLITPVETKK